MVDVVQILRVDDQMSAGADAATASLNKLADAGDKVDSTVTRVTKSGTTWVNQNDKATATANALTRALANQSAGQVAMGDALAKGKITQDQYNGAMDGLAVKVGAARAATTAMQSPLAALATGNNAAAQAATGAGEAHAGFTRELIIMGREVLEGNYSRIAGSMVVLTERSGELNAIFNEMKGALLGWPGAALAVVGTMAVLAIASESADRKLLGIETRLRAYTTDYVAGAAQVQAASKIIAASSVFSTADAAKAAETFRTAANFAGTTDQIVQLIKIAGDAGKILGVTLPEEAKAFADAMADPAKAVQDFADKHLFGFNAALAKSIELQAASGDKAGAFGRIIDQLSKQAHGAAADGMTPLQKALADLSTAFTTAGSDGKSFAQGLGEAITSVLTFAVNNTTQFIHNLNAIREWGDAHGMGMGASATPNQGTADPTIFGNYTGQLPKAPMTNPAIVPFLQSASASTGVDPNLLAALQGAEGRFVNGQWVTSPTGARGPMQVTDSTLAGMQNNPSQYPGAASLSAIADPIAQNVQAGAVYFAALLRKYGDVKVAVLAYHDGETVMDKVLASGGSASNSQEAIDEANKVGAGFSGTGLIPLVTIPRTGGNLPTGTAPGQEMLPGLDTFKTGGTFGAVNSNATDDAIKQAEAAGTAISSFQKAHAEATAYSAALADLASKGQQNSDQFKLLSEALEKAQKAEFDAIGPAALAVRTIDEQTVSVQKIGAAYSGGFAAVQKATIETEAHTAALKIASPAAANFGQIVGALEAAYTKLTHAQVDNVTAAKNLDSQQQLETLQAETSTLGEAADIRARDLAVLKERQDLIKRGADLESQASKEALANAAAISDATTNLQHQQQAIAELGNLSTQVFDQVGSAITQAFVSGQGAAVNWGNVMRAVMASVLQEVAKLAILNPLLNSITGGNATTLGSVLGVLGSVGGGAAGNGTQVKDANGNILGTLSTGSSVLSIGSSASQLLGFQGFGSFVGDQLGLTGSGGLFSGVGSSVSSFLSAGSGIGADTAGTQAITSLGIDAGSGLGGASVGSLLGGVGAGFTAGSLAGTLLQGALNKTGPAPVIGAGVGALGGAGVGALVGGPFGVLLGGLAGGILGGTGGALIGPHPATAFSGTRVGVDGSGRLTVGTSLNQIAPSSRDATQTAVDTINAFLDANNLSIQSLGKLQQIGLPNAADPTKFADFNSAFPELKFGAPGDPTLNTFLSGKSFGSADELQSQITSYDNLLNTIIPALTAQTTQTGSLNDALEAITTSFGAAITAAQSFGMATDSLVAAQDRAILQTDNAATDALIQTDVALAVRYNRAAGIDPTGTSLVEFDMSAAKQRLDFTAQLTSIYGDTYKTTQAYADQMAMLEKALGAERLSIANASAAQIAAQTAQAAQAATGTVQNILQFVNTLATGSASALSPLDQYKLAGDQFNAVSGAAMAGNFDSLQQLTGFAGTFLTSSRDVNGSGTGYATDFNRVLQVLQDAATQGPDALTAEVFTAESRTQTQTLVDSLAAVQSEVAALRAQVAQSGAAPARVAA